jgi:hypothetical protein
MSFKQLSITVFIDDNKPDADLQAATKLDIALASVEGVNDWSIENENGETFNYESAEELGTWGER